MPLLNAKSRFEETYFSKDNRYSLGLDHKASGFYASFPVTNGIADYEEYYRLTAEQYDLFTNNQQAALVFVNSCKRHERDDLLIQKPGWNRGIPI
jgi:hypothetical protein